MTNDKTTQSPEEKMLAAIYRSIDKMAAELAKADRPKRRGRPPGSMGRDRVRMPGLRVRRQELGLSVIGLREYLAERGVPIKRTTLYGYDDGGGVPAALLPQLAQALEIPETALLTGDGAAIVSDSGDADPLPSDET
jgi:hypothetical protein